MTAALSAPMAINFACKRTDGFTLTLKKDCRMQLQKTRHWIMLIIVGLLVACSGSGPEKMAVKHVEALVAGDIDRMMATLHLSEKELKELNTVKGKMSMLVGAASDEIKAAGGAKSIKVVTTEYSDDKKNAYVEIKIELGNGDSKTERVNLVQVKDGWKVSIK
jgi:hypothetical protein